MPKKKKANELVEVRRYLTVEVEAIEKVRVDDYDGPKLDPVTKKLVEEEWKKKLHVDSVTIKKIKDFPAEV